MVKCLYAGCTAAQLEKMGGEAFERDDMDALGGIIDELQDHRRTKAAKQLATTLAGLHAKLAARHARRNSRIKYRELRGSFDRPGPPDGWLDEVWRVSASVQGATTGTSCVYMALLKMPDRGRFAIYVGQTGIGPEKRYEQHKAGVKAGARYVTRYGIGMLYPFFAHLRAMSSTESVYLESALARALRLAGFEVYGGH